MNLTDQQLAIVKMGHQYGWTQRIHDRDFHQDIDCLNAKEKQSHFAHHIAKYTPTLANEDGTINYRVLTDIMIISTSIANAMRVSFKETWTKIVQGHTDVKLPAITPENAEVVILKFMARQSATLGKACEALDHLECHPSGPGIRSVMFSLYSFIYQLWTGYLKHPIEDLFDLIMNRLLRVEMAHPFYLSIKKAQHQAQLGKAIDTYTALPIRENAILKTLNAGHAEAQRWNLFDNESYVMVRDLPVLLSLESRKLVMREMNGIFTVTHAGKEHLENII